MTDKNNPLDQMKMQLLGFDNGFTKMTPGDLINQIKDRIAYFNSSGTSISDKTTKTIYNRICNEFQTAPINIFKHYN
jgi:hypothetical protein